MQLLENVKTAKASPDCIATAMKMGQLIGKKTVLVGNCDGFVGNRMVSPYASESKLMLEEGADILQVDKAATEFGMAMGPMSLGDLVGLELFWKQRKALNNMQLDTKTFIGPYELTDWLCEMDPPRFGQKTGRGIFLYDAATRKKGPVDPEVNAKLYELRATKGMKARPFTDEEICERLFFPLIN